MFLLRFCYVASRRSSAWAERQLAFRIVSATEVMTSLRNPKFQSKVPYPYHTSTARQKLRSLLHIGSKSRTKKLVTEFFGAPFFLIALASDKRRATFENFNSRVCLSSARAQSCYRSERLFSVLAVQHYGTARTSTASTI
jgi:hypothetical protein